MMKETFVLADGITYSFGVFLVELIDDLEADVVAYTEHKINPRHKKNQIGLRSIIRFFTNFLIFERLSH